MKCDQTILVVDEDLSIGKIIRDFVVSEKKRVLLAANAREGVRLLRRNHVDVLIIDLHLPDQNGASILQQAIQLHPNIASVVLTRFASLKSAIEAMRLGACNYLVKPVNRKQMEESLEHALELRRKRRTLPPQRTPLSVATGTVLDCFIYESEAMCDIVNRVKKYSRTGVPVLVCGEAGVGKRTLARLVHEHYQPGGGKFIHVTCAEISNQSPVPGRKHDSLGSLQFRQSPMESPDRTLFLEDIEQLALWQQKQLLRLLEENQIQTCYRPTPAKGSIRLIASTTANLEAAVDQGRFHRSLYDILNVLKFSVPPLRDRREDIMPLGFHILGQLSEAWGLDDQECRRLISSPVWQQLLEYEWPGNIRELASVLSRIVLMEDSTKELQDLSVTRQQIRNRTGEISVPFIGPLKSMERHMVKEVVKHCGGNKAEAARKLEMHRKTLYRILETEESTPDERHSGLMNQS